VTPRDAFHDSFRVGAAATLLCVPAAAQTVDEHLWATDGAVQAIVEHSGTIYIGGSFSRVGPATGAFAPLDADVGVPLPSFPRVTGIVFALCPDGAGGWYIGGNFSHVGGIPRSNLAHVLSDYSVSVWDPDVASAAGWSVFTITLSGSTVYIGGSFPSVGGEPRSGIAAIDAFSGYLLPWNPSAAGGQADVFAIAVDGPTVYAGGNFTSIGGQPRKNVAALDAATGAATAWDPDASSSVAALVPAGSTIYAGGYFVSIGGQTRRGIAALDAATGEATDWNPNAVGSVADLAIDGSVVYVGGDFTSIGGQSRDHLAALDVDTGAATAWDPGANDEVRSLTVGGSAVYAAGHFTSIGGQPRNYLAALDLATGAATAWNPNGTSRAYAVARHGSTVAVGGNFRILGGAARSNVAALDASTGLATSWNPGADAEVKALAVSGSTVYAGGSFTFIGAKPRNRVAALDAATGAVTGWDPNANGVVHTLDVDGSTVYAGGAFTSIGAQPRILLAGIDPATGDATSWNPIFVDGVNLQSVDAIVVTGAAVYAGGEFTCGGITTVHRNIVAFDRGTGATLAWSADQAWPDPVLAVVTDGSTVYIGGGFTDVGGQARNGIAALDAVTGSVTGWNPNAETYASPGVVHALVLDGPTVYAGGYFESIGGQPRLALAALDAVSGGATSWNPDPGPPASYATVFALAGSATAVYAGGSFRSMDGLPHAHLAAVDGSGATDAPDRVDALPFAPRLENDPNPFRFSTSIRFVLPAAARTRMDVFDVAGRRVAAPLDEAWLDAGPHEVGFRSRGLSSGVYWCRLETGGHAATRRMLVLK
jgi:hypothetical protein